MSNATIIGARKYGTVVHVMRTGMAHDVSACGRLVIPGKGEGLRVCRTCIRVSGEAFKLDASIRKAEREVRMRASVSTSEIAEEFISWEFELNAFELAMTQEKVAKINVRCEKRGIPGGLNVESREEIRKEKNDFGIVIETIVYMVKITGIAPKLPDWEFVATLDYDHNAGLIVRTYPGVNSINRENLREGWCDHCQTNRYRKNTYVMRNKASGEEIQVGSACIKDFTGWTALPYTVDHMAKDVEGMSGGFGGPRDITTLTALAVAWACVTEYGYVRSREPGATVGYVRDVINPPKPDRRNAEYIAELTRVRNHSETMMERAKELREFILSDDFKGDDDFVLNIRSIVRAEMVSPKNLGYLSYTPQAWARFLETSFIKERETGPVSEWIGEVKGKYELFLTVKAIKYLENDFGSTALHTFTDDIGNVLMWFASNADYGDCIGERFRMVGTVKEHREFKGTRQTMLTRVKELEENDKLPKGCIPHAG